MVYTEAEWRRFLDWEHPEPCGLDEFSEKEEMHDPPVQSLSRLFRNMEIGELNTEELRFSSARRIV
jgi:hypothetical protein